ncbi:MAG: hypothetical protein JW751_16725 [Polyangiaceae bacterium]|nr:hypothetical protein [Polyangiaceae bacterium]
MRRMRKAEAWLVVVVGLGLVGGCGDDGGEDDGGGSGGRAATGGTSNGGSGPAGTTNGGSGAGMDGTGATGGGEDPCERGCVETMAASCENGPSSQGECVSDCHALQDGDCGAEYDAFQACAEGETITCSSLGIPMVEACMTEQLAFIACLT